MPYYSGSATVSAGPPVSYKMPVPSSSRYSSYRSSSSSLERPLYSSSTGSYLTSRSTYTTEYRSKFTSPSRTSSVPSYSRTSSLSDDSGRFTSSSRDRSESRETSSASAASSTTPSSTLGRRYNSASTISVGLSAAELYNKYSPSNYVSDIGRPPATSSTTSSYSRRSGSTTQPAETKASATNSRLSGSRGAVGGCFTAAVTPSTERRSRASVNEVISHFNSNASASNNNNTSDSESSSSSGDEDGQGCRRELGNNDDNGNNGEEQPQRTVAERRRRFDGSGSGGVDGSSNSTALHTTSSGRQHGGGSRRRREDTVPRASPSPVPIRKVFNNTGALSSDDDDEEEEEEETSKKSDDSGEEESSEDDEGSKIMSATRRTRAGVAGGASAATDPSGSSIAGASRYGRSQATAQLSPKTKSRQYHPESSILNASPRISRLNTRCCSNERAGLTGLRNIGNTCFMNSVIQCLSNTKPLLEYVLAESYLAEINSTSSGMKGALFKAFATVIQELWRNESDATIVNTTSLKSQIQRFAPRFMGYSQQDAQEFLRYLLEGLHEDVNRITSKPKPILTEIEDSLSDQQKAVESWKRYLRMDDSKVVDIFVGQLKSTLRCTVCGHCSVTFDPFWDLSLPIPSRTGQLRLQQCLDHFTREEVMDGDEKPTCSKCQMRRKCTKSFTIQKFPKILVLHLKRFSPMERFRGKLNVTVDFPLTGLDLSAYAASRGQGSMYNLYGVANHSGTTYSGHYTAYCRHPYSGDWHEYNDSRVSSISSRSVVSSEAYVLFYELSGHSSHL